MPQRSWMLISILAASLGWSSACTDPSLGATCEVDSDCADGLVCDLHAGQGTCQEPHDHEAGEDTSAADSASETGAETAGETGADTDGDGCEAYAVGLSKTGAWATATFVSADPAPPIKGDNTWVLRFTDADDAPLDGLTIVVIPMMPEHGHGTPVQAIVTPTGTPGEYSVAPVNLFMAGLWQTTFDITLGEQQDSLMFSFCVE